MNAEEISIEAQLADIIVRPQPEKRYCAYGDGTICKTSLSQHNKATMCYLHESRVADQLRSKRVGDASGALTPAMRLCSTPNCPSVLWEENKRGICAKCRAKLAKRVSPDAVSAPAVVDADTSVNIEAVAAAPLPPAPATDPAPEVEPAPATLDDFIVQLKEENDQEEERTPMTNEMAKACAVEGCETALGNYNKSGRCGAHSYITRGMKFKDGSVPRPLPAEIAAKVAALPTKQKPEKATIEPIAEPEPAAVPNLAPPAERIALHVPPEALDMFWAKLAITDKARIVELAISGAW